jgi:predicted phosphodiesterase
MLAILSDIHGNFEAMKAVLEDIADQGECDIICLGDTIGYGPDPIDCLAWATGWKTSLMGNFEAAVTTNEDLEQWSAQFAAVSLRWARQLIASDPVGGWLLNWIKALPSRVDLDSTAFVHGSLRNPTQEYLFAEDIYNDRKMRANFERFGKLCFCGHTHVPGIFLEERPNAWNFLTPDDVNHEFKLNGGKVICNVGSVGQPRDTDWRTGYVLFDGETIRFRRLEYDIEKTVAKIYANPELENFLGDRLREGR